jgi:DMSO/TMAO reductase YedYZ molybdopterin-dependent catalytic subunit
MSGPTDVAHSGGPLALLRELRRLWPRRANGLPPGQRALDAFPRFADDPRRRAPDTVGCTVLTVVPGPGLATVDISHAELAARSDVVDHTADFHCVTTWTARGVTWTGVRLVDLWRDHIEAVADSDARYATVEALDGQAAVFLLDDLLADDVMVAWLVNGQPLGPRHGGPLRLVSPGQYGYKNVKHISTVKLHARRPPSRLGSKEHLRARVAHEERHDRLPPWLLRWPYRVLVPFTALVAERSVGRPATVAVEAEASVTTGRPG